MRSIGKFSARMGSNKEFIAGMIEGMNPRVIGEVLNESAGFIGEVTKHLDAKALAESMSESMGLVGEVMQYIDPEAVAQLINSNERILPRFVEHVNPNVFTRSAGTVFTKLRYATYRPPMFAKPGEVNEE